MKWLTLIILLSLLSVFADSDKGSKDDLRICHIIESSGYIDMQKY